MAFASKSNSRDTLRSNNRFATGMLNQAKTHLRRTIRAFQRASQFPLLLPHHQLTAHTLTTINNDTIPLAESLSRALSLCNGQRTLAQIAAQAKLPKTALIKAQDDGLLLIWRSPVPAAPPAADHPPHAIILSPHLDDAALSCGGRMLGGQAVLVLNLFSQTAWWRFGHAPQDQPKIQSCRQMEENLVARLSGAAMQNLDLPEALLRGYAMENVFDTTQPPPDRAQRNAQVSQQIAQTVAALFKQHPLAHWYLPLGIGNHIDHRLARDAAAAALQSAGLKTTHLHFYEDLPYAAKLGPTADFSKHLEGHTLREEQLDIDDQLPWKLELLRAYWSQFRWNELAELRTYAKAAGAGEAAEITWTPA